jgi:hypothetical protein
MERRYKDELDLRFDQVADYGFSVITDDELLRWWDRKRVTASVWQDMLEKWEERNFTDGDGRAVPLMINAYKSRFVLAWGEEGWLVPVSDWAKGG